MKMNNVDEDDIPPPPHPTVHQSFSSFGHGPNVYATPRSENMQSLQETSTPSHEHEYNVEML